MLTQEIDFLHKILINNYIRRTRFLNALTLLTQFLSFSVRDNGYRPFFKRLQFKLSPAQLTPSTLRWTPPSFARKIEGKKTQFFLHPLSAKRREGRPAKRSRGE